MSDSSLLVLRLFELRRVKVKSSVDRLAFIADHEGKTFGVTELGEFEISGEIASWMLLVASWLRAGIDIGVASADYDSDRRSYVRRIYKVLEEVGVVREATPPGALRILEQGSYLSTALAMNMQSLPATTLGVGTLHGEWLLSRIECDHERVGAVLLTSDAALVVGPLSARDFRAMVVSLQEQLQPGERPEPEVIRTAVAQLVRRTAMPDSPWRGITATRAGTTDWRLSPHPWLRSAQGATAEEFDIRVMSIIDRTHGLIRDVGEFDLPQVPYFLSQARVAGFRHSPTQDLLVLGTGSSFAEARRHTIEKALAVHAETVLDPRVVWDNEGRRCASPDDTMDQLREAYERIVGAPESHYLSAYMLSGGQEMRVSVADVLRPVSNHRAAVGVSVAENPGHALTAALLETLEVHTGSRTESLDISAVDLEFQDTAVSECLRQLRSIQPEAWLGVVPGSQVPTVSVTTTSGTSFSCGMDYSGAAVSALRHAAVNEQLRLSGHDMVFQPTFPAIPYPTSFCAFPKNAPISAERLSEVFASIFPATLVINLDHDGNLRRLGLSALKVVAQS